MSPSQNGQENEEEEDYMSMTFDDTPTNTTTTKPKPSSFETSLQRRQRLRREAEIRGRPKSKLELAAEAERLREEALSRPLIPGFRGGEEKEEEGEREKKGVWGAGRTVEKGGGGGGGGKGKTNSNSKGLAMMQKMGYKVGNALGVDPSSSSSSFSSAIEKRNQEEDEKDEKAKEEKQQQQRRQQQQQQEEEKEKEKEKDHRIYEPIPLQIKQGRGGIGLDTHLKRQFPSSSSDPSSSKRPRIIETETQDEFLLRVRRERQENRLTRVLESAMKVCEGIEEEESSKTKKAASSSIPQIPPVEYRRLVLTRDQRDRDRRMRHDLEQSGNRQVSHRYGYHDNGERGEGEEKTQKRLPRYDEDDLEADADDAMAMGRDVGRLVVDLDIPRDDDDDNDDDVGVNKNRNDAVVMVEGEEGEGDDKELQEFEALPVEQRLARVVGRLRTLHRYCFWCKFAYPDDAAMAEGCPGETEDDHD